MKNKILKNNLITKSIAFLTILMLLLSLMMPSYVLAEELPTIKLNLNDTFTINPYEYIHKDYKNKEINFNISKANVASMALVENKKIVFTGKSAGDSLFTISSEGKELYKININVNETNTIETSNLDPIENNAALSDEDTSENIKPNMPTIKLNVSGNYTIRPYDYVAKEYQTNGKRIHFNMSSSNIATMSLNRETKEITFTGVSKGSSEFTISSEGKELYKIDIKVNDKYTPEALNLRPINTDNNQGNNQDNNQNGNGNNNGNQPGNKDNNTPNPNPDNGNNNTPNPEPKPNIDNNTNSNMPTIKLKVDKEYAIDPYDYVHKDYKYKQLDFNIANTSVAKMEKEGNKIKLEGVGNGNTVFTISSEGKELYKININVNDTNIVGASNLSPIKDNANTPDNNNNNNNNNVDPNVTPNMPTIKLNVNKDYTINPYNYVHKDYKYKPLHFNIANTSVATSSLNKETKLITFKGIGNGNTIFTISSEGKELYKINIDVNDKNIVGVSNLDPIKDNANTPDNNNNNNNNQNQKPDNNKPDNKPNPVPDNNKNNQGNGNNQNQQPNINNNPGKQDNGSINNHEYGNRYVPHNNNGNGNNDNIHQNNGKVIGSNDRETTPIPPTSDPLAESGYYTPKGETPNNPEKPNNVDLSKNPNTKPVNPTPNKVKPNVIPRSGLDYTIYGAIILGIAFAGFALTKYLKYNKMVKQPKIK